MKFVGFGEGVCLGQWPDFLGDFVVRIKHGDDVTRNFVYFVWCDCREVCEFGEVYECCLVGCVCICVA